MTKKQLTRRHKKIIHSIAVTRNESGTYQDLTTLKGKEAAILRQFNLIQRDYLKLMSDVYKEWTLVRGWIGTQARSKRVELTNRLSARLSKDSL